MRMIIILLLFSVNAYAQDEWACTEAGIQRSGDVWKACGVGESLDEAHAREHALDNAIREFKQLCDLSSECRDKKRSVEPGRTTCGPVKASRLYASDDWKCFRMVKITLY